MRRRSAGPSHKPSSLYMLIFMIVDFGAGIGRTQPRSIPPRPVRWWRPANDSRRRAPSGGGVDTREPGSGTVPGGGPAPVERGELETRGATREGRVPEEGGRGAGEAGGGRGIPVEEGGREDTMR